MRNLVDCGLIDFESQCCGCGSCVDSCPKGAISMEVTSYGYRVPSVYTASCVDCGKCISACPVIQKKSSTYESRKVYSAFAKNEKQRLEGSSGSVFYSLGKWVIENNGVVFGASFEENLQLKHKGVEDLSSLSSLMKSKYIQSDTLGVYNQIKSILSDNRPVLFVGTPCQCNAVYNVVKDKSNLYLVDFICHGVPSQEFFDKSIQRYEKRKCCSVKSFSFRYKYGMKNKNFKIKYEKDGQVKEWIAPYWKFPYYAIFYLYASFRKSCYRCPFVGVDRVSDLTISDFWGLNMLDTSVKDMGKGYSMVITNSSKGEAMFEAVAGDLSYKEGFLLQNAIDYNSSYTRCEKDGLLSHLFRWMYVHTPFAVLETIFPLFSYPNRMLQKVKYVRNKIFARF